MATALKVARTKRQAGRKKLDDEGLVHKVHRFVSANSIDGDASRSQHRIDALKRYRGDKQGDEVEGRSQVVSRDVMEVVESLMPSLVKIFTASDKIVEFTPAFTQTPEAFSKAQAEGKLATALVNHVFFKENDGFTLLYNGIKAALMNRFSTIKVWWDNDPEGDNEVYENCDGQEMASLLLDPTLKVVSIEDDRGNHIEADAPDPKVLENMITGGQGQGSYTIVVRNADGVGRCRLEAVPPEQFVYDQYATNLNEARIQCAHHRQMSVSDVIGMGVPADVAEKLATKDERDGSSERQNRMDRRDTSGSSSNRTAVDDGADDDGMVWVTDAFLFVDRDGDGRAEYRRIVIAGPECEDAYVIEDKEVDDHWFAHLSPILMPFEPEGESIDDQISDIQRLKTTLWRQMLDNLYRANAPRIGVLEGQASLADVLSQQPGQPIRMRRADALFPIVTPFTAQQSFPMLEHADVTREQRTGIVRYNQGVDADTLNKTATGISIISQAGQQRPELIARTFAETGFKRMAWLILRMTVRNQNAPRVIEVADAFVPVEPRKWRSKFSITARVGVGTGNKDQLVLHLSQIVEQQKQVLMTAGPQNPLVTLEHLYAGFTELLDAMGIKGANRFFGNPAGWEPPPPPPDPDAVVKEAQAEKIKVEAQVIPAKLQEEVRSNQAQEQIEKEKNLITMANNAATHMHAEAAHESESERHEITRRDAGLNPARKLRGDDVQQITGEVGQVQAQQTQMLQAIQQLMQQQAQMLGMLGQFITAETELEYDGQGNPVKARRVFPGQQPAQPPV